MHPMNRTRVWSMMGLLALGLSVTTGQGLAQERPAPMVTFDKSGAVIVSIGGQARFQMRSKKVIKDVFNDAVRVVQVLADATDRSFVILSGGTAGSAKIELTDVDGGKETYVVIVQRDMEMLRTLIKKTVPTASVDVTPIGESGTSIIVAGYAAREDDRDAIIKLAEALGLKVAVNHVTVGGGGNVPHVQLDLTLAKVDRTRARSRGASFIINGTTVSGGSLLGGLATLQPSGAATAAGAGIGATASAAATIPSASANLIFGVVPSQFQALLAALKTEGIAKLVSAPSVVAQSGQLAHLLSGSSIPVVSASSGITGPGVEYKPVGTRLDVLPTVYGNGKIHLNVHANVKTVRDGQALVTTFATSPAFDEQDMDTTLICEPGQTVAIGGLIQTSIGGSVTKIPFLGDIPYLGVLFSYATQTEQETELIILITPRLIDPADSCQMPKALPGSETRKPDDFEFYLETMVEAPRGSRTIWEGHRYKAPWKSSPTAATYPCVGGAMAAPGGGCATGTCPAPAGGMAPTKVIVTPPAVLPTGGLTELPNDLTVTPPTAAAPVEPVPAPPAALLAPVVLPGRSSVEGPGGR